MTLIALLWTGLSGTAGIGFQNWDHEKHNAMLFDLVKDTYPVFYPPQKDLNINSSSPLVFYIAYYLLPAVIGKLTSYKIANIVQFAQLFLQLNLCFFGLLPA